MKIHPGVKWAVEQLFGDSAQSSLVLSAKQVGTLYHFTPVGQIVGIFKNGALFSERRVQYGPYEGRKFLSFTRNPRLEFNAGYSNEDKVGFNANARIVIDGTKLSNHNKVLPTTDLETEASHTGREEAEEAVILPEGMDSLNIKPYVLRVDLFNDPTVPNYNAKWMPEAIEVLKKAGIAYRVLDTKAGRAAAHAQTVEAGLSKILYHGTSLHSLEKILTQNAFQLSTMLGTASDDIKRPEGYFYFFSTSRSKIGHYNKSRDVQLVLDGEKLNQKYPGEAVDYWGPAFKKADPRKNEMEDRLWSREPQIKNADQYIKEIHILVNFKNLTYDNWKNWIKNAYAIAQEKNIPIYLYEDQKAFEVLDKTKTVPLESLDLEVKNPYEYQSSSKRKYIEPILELYNKSSEEELSNEAQKKLYSLSWYFQDFVSSLLADIHNYKKDPDAGIADLVDILRKEKLKNVKEFAEFLKKKWLVKT
jgi:hypothetical protein